MIQTVVKRDGRIVGFNEQKIMAAIRKAMMHTEKGEDDALVQKITDHICIHGKSQMTVEKIQDSVEMELMKSARKDVAQKYIAYRNQRSIARKAKTRDVFMEIVNIKNNDVTREYSGAWFRGRTRLFATCQAYRNGGSTGLYLFGNLPE